MKVKRLITALVLAVCVIGSALVPGASTVYATDVEPKTQMGMELTLDDLDDILIEGKIIHQDENSTTIIKPATEEDIIEFLTKEKRITYKEAKKLYEEEQQEGISPMGYDEELRTATIRSTYRRLWGDIGLELNARVEYVYNIATRKAVSIEEYQGSYIDTIGTGASFAYFDMTDGGPDVDISWYRIEVSYYGKPVIDVTEEVNASLSAFGFVEVGIGYGGTIRVRPANPIYVEVGATIEDL